MQKPCGFWRRRDTSWPQPGCRAKPGSPSRAVSISARSRSSTCSICASSSRSWRPVATWAGREEQIPRPKRHRYVVSLLPSAALGTGGMTWAGWAALLLLEQDQRDAVPTWPVFFSPESLPTASETIVPSLRAWGGSSGGIRGPGADRAWRRPSGRGCGRTRSPRHSLRRA